MKAKGINFEARVINDWNYLRKIKFKKKAKNILKKMKSKIIVYVSCNPVTLARDILDLSEDYKLNEITLYDMFPNSYHVETVVLLEYRKPL